MTHSIVPDRARARAHPGPREPRPTPSQPDRRGAGQRRVAWFSARARNALRRPGRLWAVAGVVFTVVVLTLILVPRQAQRAFAALMPRPDEWRDSVAANAALQRAEAELASARAAFLAAREEATAPPPQPVVPRVVLTPEQLRQRDSLQAAVAAIQRELARVVRSPLPASYRQLGELPEVAAEPRVRGLLDSLAAVEREREEFAALGGVDPIYVSLTSRVNAIGRTIQGVAERRVAAAQRALAEMEPPPPPAPIVVERPPVDTMGPLRRVVGAEQAQRSAQEGLEMVLRTNAALLERADAARQGANFIAPPTAVLAAALVMALVAGYLTVLVGELRLPRVADGEEVERETGLRTLGVVTVGEGPGGQPRRRSDERSPDVLDPREDVYRTLHLHLSPIGGALPVVAITGDEPTVVATVAANLAAAAAAEARETLLVDANLRSGVLASALRVRPAPGVSELLRGDVAWPDTVASAIFGRERVVDVIPAGARQRGRPPSVSDGFRREMQRMARRYDLTVVATPLDEALLGAEGILPSPDVVLAVRAPVTRLADLHAAVATLRSAGLRIQGVVLWDGEAPAIEPYSPAEWRERARVS